MPGFLPALLLCTLSPSNALACRNSEGAEVRLREGAIRLDAPRARRLVSLGEGGLCYVSTPNAAGAGRVAAHRGDATPLLRCFDGNGELRPFLDARGNPVEVAAGEREVATHSHACVLDAGRRLRCHAIGGREHAFALEGREARLEGVTRFALEAPGAARWRSGDGTTGADDAFACAGGPAVPVRCFVLPGAGVPVATTPNAPEGAKLASAGTGVPSSLGTKAGAAPAAGAGAGPRATGAGTRDTRADGTAVPLAAITLRNETGRALEAADTAGADFALSGSRLCHAKPGAALRCHDLPSGREYAFRGKAGFREEVDASRGIAFGDEALCAIGAAGAIACRDPVTGAPLEFRNDAGFKEELPAATALRLEGTVACLEPAAATPTSSALPASAAPRDAGAGARTKARAPDARNGADAPPAHVCYLDRGRIVFRDTTGRRAEPPRLGHTTLEGGRLCGVDPAGHLRCWDVAGRAGAEIAFLGEAGFPSPVSVSGAPSIGARALCAADAARELRCAGPGGDALVFRNALGGKSRIEDVAAVRVVGQRD